MRGVGPDDDISSLSIANDACSYFTSFADSDLVRRERTLSAGETPPANSARGNLLSFGRLRLSLADGEGGTMTVLLDLNFIPQISTASSGYRGSRASDIASIASHRDISLSGRSHGKRRFDDADEDDSRRAVRLDLSSTSTIKRRKILPPKISGPASKGNKCLVQTPPIYKTSLFGPELAHEMPTGPGHIIEDPKLIQEIERREESECGLDLIGADVVSPKNEELNNRGPSLRQLVFRPKGIGSSNRH